jgi:hypothetical protein
VEKNITSIWIQLPSSILEMCKILPSNDIVYLPALKMESRSSVLQALIAQELLVRMILRKLSIHYGVTVALLTLKIKTPSGPTLQSLQG